jgi:hypothetical protein
VKKESEAIGVSKGRKGPVVDFGKLKGGWTARVKDLQANLNKCIRDFRDRSHRPAQ